MRQCSSSPSLDSSRDKTVNLSNQPTPIALPQSGVSKQASSTPNKSLGRIRIFLRAPVPSDKSSFQQPAPDGKSSGNIRNGNHHFVEMLDWQSDTVVATAFIRSGDMVKLSVPFGSSKLRYAVGTEWYEEKAMFGSEDMYEMTKQSSLETLKFEITNETPGGDIGTYCSNGNLGKKRVRVTNWVGTEKQNKIAP
jgi:hypothetical protein